MAFIRYLDVLPKSLAFSLPKMSISKLFVLMLSKVKYISNFSLLDLACLNFLTFATAAYSVIRTTTSDAYGIQVDKLDLHEYSKFFLVEMVFLFSACLALYGLINKRTMLIIPFLLAETHFMYVKIISSYAPDILNEMDSTLKIINSLKERKMDHTNGFLPIALHAFKIWTVLILLLIQLFFLVISYWNVILSLWKKHEDSKIGILVDDSSEMNDMSDLILGSTDAQQLDIIRKPQNSISYNFDIQPTFCNSTFVKHYA